MTTLMILNDAPYGSERTYNGLRLAGSIARRGQKVPSGYELTDWTLEADRVITF